MSVRPPHPGRAHCGCRVIGHGAEADGKTCCCAHAAGIRDVSDRADRVAAAPAPH